MRAPYVGSVVLAGLLACLYLGSACALGLADLTNRDAAEGIKGALNKGAASAIDKLGVAGGFLNKVSLAQKYDRLADQGNIEEYVTRKTLDGLYLMIGEEEHSIRQNPAAAGSAIISKVFGALR
jgi:hypothetical protein